MSVGIANNLIMSTIDHSVEEALTLWDLDEIYDKWAYNMREAMAKQIKAGVMEDIGYKLKPRVQMGTESLQRKIERCEL